MSRWLVALGCWGVVAVASGAEGYWLPATDARLRDDLALLVDESVLELPSHTWPMPVADVRRELERVRLGEIAEPALLAAWSRLSAATGAPAHAGSWSLQEVSLGLGEPGLLRNYETAGREGFEVSARGGFQNTRLSLAIESTFAASPDDDQSFRLDGSSVTIRAGNWLFSASQLDRWWGPGRIGSLILSTNARPMPQLSLDRLQSSRSSLPILRWAGPWRFSGFIAAMESDRPDLEGALFMGMRLSFKPVPILEVGLSRTAQFCGQNPARTRAPCNLEQVGRMLVGKDNRGFRGVDPDNEPGNQMAGIDVRVVSPFPRLPVSLYTQLIGEDSSSNSQSIIPNRYLGLFGMEIWGLLDSGAAWRFNIEYANTSCKWYSPAGNENCAYRSGVFTAGYRYRGRTIGHATDADAESTSVQWSLMRNDGSRWSALLRHGTLDRDGTVDPWNPVSEGRNRFEAVEGSWSGRVLGEEVSAQIGYERQSGQNARQDGVYGFIKWRKALRL